MGLRQTLNENPVITSVVVGVLTLVALFFVGREACGGPSSGGEGGPDKAFYTVDEGKTRFVADANKIPPFDHEGKKAYKVVMYKCADGKEIVAYLERYPEDQHAAIEQAGGPMGSMLGALAKEVRKPGEKKWVSMQREPAEYGKAVLVPKCADGTAPTLLMPE